MAARDNVDLDRIVDYKAEYTAAISKEKLRISGDSLLGLCPFHHESNPSFSVDLKTGKATLAFPLTSRPENGIVSPRGKAGTLSPFGPSSTA